MSAAAAEPRALPPATAIEPSQSCLFGRFRLYLAPMDLGFPVAFSLILRAEADGGERSLPFSRQPGVQTFAVAPGRYTVTKMSSELASQYRESPLSAPRPLVVDAQAGRCHYLGDLSAVVALKSLETVQTPSRATTPYSWRVASAEDRFEAARGGLDAARFPFESLDSAFVPGVFPAPSP